jgi:hypothetical protein
MMNQNKEYEDMPVKEKKKKQELREAGMDVNGEFPEKVVQTGRRSSVNLRGSSMPDGGADDGEEPEGVTDHGSKFGYYDGIYHEPAGIRVICKGNDGQIK